MIEINNFTNFAINNNTFSTVAKKVLSGENRKKQTISLAFIGKGEIKKLNKKFRRKNQPTDVLSFELKESFDGAGKDFLGEVVICPEIVKKNAKGAFEREMIRVFIHGILHLCGYDHERSEKEARIMQDKEIKYLVENFR